ncbi:uncharacterized protein FYW49_006375 [Xenentodon cancila]
MAAPTESLLSLGHLTGTERNTFTKQRKPIVKKSKVIHLQRRWQELQQRERFAQQHNRQLLQQFEKAQDALEDMVACNAAMKTIRTEYERYLEKNFHRWQQELAEKTQAAQKKRMDDCLRSNLKRTEEERVHKPTVEGSLLFQGPSTGPPRNAAPQVHSIPEYSDYNQDSCPQPPYIQSWLTHSESQTGRFPVRAPYHPHSPSLVLPPNFIQPHPFLFHHLTSPPSHHHPWTRNNTAGWPSSQQPYLWPWGAGAAGIPPGSWGELYTEEPPPELRAAQSGEERDDTGRAQSSKKERVAGSTDGCLSQELDIKPVRLSSGCAQSSGSGRDSSLTSREKKKDKSGITQHSSTEEERCDSQQSSTNSSEIIIASQTVAKSVERDSSTEEGSTRSSGTKTRGGLCVGSPRSEKVPKEQTKKDAEDSQGYDEESQKVQTATAEESGSSTEESMKEKEQKRGGDDNSGSCRTEEESESDSVKTENEAADEEKEKEESSISEQSSTEEKHKGHTNVKALEQEEYSQKGGEQEDSSVEEDDDDVSDRKNTTVEEAEDKMDDQGNDEQSDKLKDKGYENKKDSSSSVEEDVDTEGSEGSEDQLEEEEEGSNQEGDDEEEEDRSDEAQDDNTDSNDSIISPQQKRYDGGFYFPPK